MKKLLSVLFILCMLSAPLQGLASLPVIATTPVPEVPALPNPGTNYNVEATLNQTNFVFPDDGLTYDVYTFPLVNNWGDLTSDYLNACTNRGLKWTSSHIDGIIAYIITAGDLKAILVPNYSGFIMLMVQKGLEMEKAAITEEEPLKLGEGRLYYNGNLCAYSSAEINGYYRGYHTLNVFPVAKDPNIVNIKFSNDVRTGQVIDITRDHPDKTVYFLTLNDSLVYDGHLQSNGKKDFFKMEIILSDADSFWFTFEGSFNDGATTISGEFYLPKP